MDFIPAGYLSIRDAVDRILRTTHGDDWGEQEVKFETDAIDGSMVLDDDSLSKGQPLDRQAVAKVRQQGERCRGVASFCIPDGGSRSQY